MTFFWDFLEIVEKRAKRLKVSSLARSVPKPLKVPSLARSVPKPLFFVPRASFPHTSAPTSYTLWRASEASLVAPSFAWQTTWQTAWQTTWQTTWSTAWQTVVMMMMIQKCSLNRLKLEYLATDGLYFHFIKKKIIDKISMGELCS